jgi:CRP-like cAMP-binding protein
MSLAEEVDLLRGIPLFEKMEAPKLKLLAISSDRVNFRPGAVMMRQGDEGDAAYVIISGKGDVIVDTPAGEIKVAEVSSGQIVGEIAILIDVPRTATVKTEQGLTALKIGKENFIRLLNGSPQVAIEIIKVLASRLENTTAQLREAVSAKSS